MHPDEGYQQFLKLYEKYKDQLDIFNEADTRAKIIDFILRDCLAGKKYISREKIMLNLAAPTTNYYMKTFVYLLLKPKTQASILIFQRQ
ncbi:MAG: hypothetical protein ABSH06_29855 [Thermodesulfobacteriota bacterium]|jgi:hypothetical protein